MNTSNTSTRAKLQVFAVASFALSASLSAVDLAHYNFESSGSPFEDVVALSGLTASSLSLGSQANEDGARSIFAVPDDGGSAAYIFKHRALIQSRSTTSLAFAEAQSAGAFFQFTLTADSGNTLDLQKMSFSVAHKSIPPETGSASYRVLVTSDVTGDEYDDRLALSEATTGDNSLPNVLQNNGEIGEANGRGSSSWAPSQNTIVDLSGSEFDSIASATFKVYAFTLKNSHSSAVLRFDNIIVDGVVVPEVGTFAFLSGIMALGLVVLRRRRGQV